MLHRQVAIVDKRMWGVRIAELAKITAGCLHMAGRISEIPARILAPKTGAHRSLDHAILLLFAEAQKDPKQAACGSAMRSVALDLRVGASCLV